MPLFFRPATGRRIPSRRVGSSRRPRLQLGDLPWKRIVVYVLVLAGISVLLYSRVDMETVQREAARLNGIVAFGLLVVLPLLGFPASLLHVAAGIRFGTLLGLGLVALSIALQLLISYTVVHVWRRRFESSHGLKKLRERIPQGAHASVCAFTVLLPGAPYTAVNYALPLMGVPLRTLLLCAWPLHVLRSTITVSLGGHSAHLTTARLAVLIAYAATILAVSWWAFHRLQGQFSGPRRAADDRKRRA